jgi:hypothetical protein
MKRIAFAALALLGTGCLFNDSSTAPSEISLLTTPAIELWEGTLGVGTSQQFAFTQRNPDPVRVTLASVISTATNLPVTTNLTLGFGTPSGDVCTLSFSASATPALVAQYLQVNTAGNYCVVLTDPGTLTVPVKFTVRISHS